MTGKTISHAISNISTKYIDEAADYAAKKKSHKPVWIKISRAAACLAMLAAALTLVILPNVTGRINEILPENPDDNFLHPSGEIVPADIPEKFVAIRSLLAQETVSEMAAVVDHISIGPYTGLYEKVSSVESTVLSESIGNAVSGEDGWYYVLGHSDMQYLIRNDEETYSLWKFSSFNEENYPYSFVLEHVYQIVSSDQIHAITVSPAKMDNSAEGIAIQEKIGTIQITDREEIDEMYQILCSLTCYGSNHWDMIDTGAVDAPADAEPSAHQAVLLGRYLSVETDYGNEIDGLKYTAVSNMFYEFSGIAYNRLSKEQAERVKDILGIETTVDSFESQTDQGIAHSTDENRDPFLVEASGTNVSLEYITELQEKVSNAMLHGELPFVVTSAVYENPYRLHVVVTSNAESDLQKLQELDSAGGALEIQYDPATGNAVEKY